MLLKFIRNTILFTAFILANHIAVGQNTDAIQNEFSEIKKEESIENKDQLIQNEAVVEDVNFDGKFSFNKRNRKIDKNKPLVSKDHKTKIGSLFIRISSGIKKYCHDNNISGKRLFKIGRLFI